MNQKYIYKYIAIQSIGLAGARENQTKNIYSSYSAKIKSDCLKEQDIINWFKLK